MTGDVVAIVDPFASGGLLAGEFAARGWRPVAVRSAEAVPDVFASSWRPEEFAEVVAHAGDVEGTAAALERLGARAVVAGCELGVELADALAERLGLPANDPAARAARRDKFLMAERVRAAGLRTADQLRTSDRDEAARWAASRGRWPVIVKPLRSSSSDHVARCASPEEVGDAVDAVLDSITVLDQRNDAALVQEYLEGTESIVDTVSLDGRHLLTAIWRYDRPTDRDTFVCYDAMTLVPGDGERQRALVAYARGVLDALGIRHGPAHCELMWVDDEPVLVEVGARLSAGNNCTLNRDCSGVCQLDLMVEAVADPAAFKARDDAPYVLRRTAANVFLLPQRRGILRGAPRLAEIEALESAREVHVGLEPGQPAPRVAGVVTLLHDDPAVVARDTATIRHLERNGLFDITPA